MSHYLSLTSSFEVSLRDPRRPGLTEPRLQGRELNYGSHAYFLTTQGHGGPSRMSDQPNSGTTSETAQTSKTIHTKHTLSHANKANMEWRLRWPNVTRGPWVPKASWHLSYRWGKTPKKPHPGDLSRPGIEPGPAAWQARMLPLAPQRWTGSFYLFNHPWIMAYQSILESRIKFT